MARGHHQRFADGLAAALVGGLHQHLRDDGEQALRQEALGLFALFDRQRVDDAVDGLRRREVVCSVPSTRWPVSAAVMAMRDGFGVAQLADQDDVGVFAHRGAHAFGERRDVRAQLALDDLACLLRWTNSIGSSSEMMLSRRVVFR